MPTPNYTEDDFQNGIQANAPVVPIENASAVYNPKRKLTSDELIQQFYSVKEKAPEIDQAKVDRLRRMGRINQLAQGTKVLADIAGTAMGANVRKRQPDQTAPALFQSYQNMLDKYRDETDAYNLRDFSVKRQNAQFGLQRADADKARDLSNRRQAAIEKNNEAKTALENSKFLAGLRQKQEALNNTKAYQKGRLSIEGEKLKIAKEKKDKESDKPFMVAGLNGQDIPLTQGEFRDLLAEATQAANKAGANSPQFKDFQATMESFKDNPLEGQKNIVQRYYGWKKEQESLSKNRELKGSTTQPVQQTPKAQFNPDKAKKFKGVVPQGGF